MRRRQLEAYTQCKNGGLDWRISFLMRSKQGQNKVKTRSNLQVKEEINCRMVGGHNFEFGREIRFKFFLKTQHGMCRRGEDRILKKIAKKKFFVQMRANGKQVTLG